MNPKKGVTIFFVLTYMVIAADKLFVSKQFPKPRVLLALTVALIILGFGAEFAPELALAFAVLIFVSVMLTQGAEVFTGLNRAFQGGN